MHELSYIEDMLKTINTSLENEDFNKVLNVRIKIGTFSGLEAEAIDFCFSHCIHATKLEGAKLIIDKAPYKIKCKSCQKESYPEDYTSICPHCKKNEIDILSGREIELVDMEVE